MFSIWLEAHLIPHSGFSLLLLWKASQKLLSQQQKKKIVLLVHYASNIGKIHHHELKTVMCSFSCAKSVSQSVRLLTKQIHSRALISHTQSNSLLMYKSIRLTIVCHSASQFTSQLTNLKSMLTLLLQEMQLVHVIRLESTEWLHVCLELASNNINGSSSVHWSQWNS